MSDIIAAMLGGAWTVFGLLLYAGKPKVVIVYRDEDTPPWPAETDIDDYEEKAEAYVKPLEMPSQQRSWRPQRRNADDHASEYSRYLY